MSTPPNPPINPNPNDPNPLPPKNPPPQPAVIHAGPVDVPAFGALVKDSTYADGKGGTMTAAQYREYVKAHEKFLRQQEELKNKGTTSEDI